MRRGGSVVLLAVMAVAGLAAGILVPGGGASAKASPHRDNPCDRHRDGLQVHPVEAQRSRGDGDLHRHQQGQGLPRLQDRREEDSAARARSLGDVAGHVLEGPVPLPLHRFRPGIARHEGRLLGRSAAPTPTPTPTTTTTRPPRTPRRPGRSVRPTRRSLSHCSRRPRPRHRSLSDDDPVGHGHVRDHEQLHQAPAASTSRASRRARYSTRANRRHGRSRSPRASTATTATWHLPS